MKLNASTIATTSDSNLPRIGTDMAANIPSNVATSAVEHLLEWQAADEPDIAWQKICYWRQAHSDHEQAWQQIERVNKKIALLAVKAESDVSHAALIALPVSRREALKNLSTQYRWPYW
jgi:transmembrane sensor